jgi:hypothetical protein
MIRDYIANAIATALAPTIARNIIDGVAEFDKHSFSMPVRCKARRWMKRGEVRVDLNALGFLR